MTAHTATGPQMSPSEAIEHARAPDLARGSATQPNLESLRQPGGTEGYAEGQPGGGVETQVEEVAKVALATTAVVIGVPLLIGVTLFTAGFLRRPIERALGRLALRLQDIQVSSGLPLAIMDILREMRADMDVMSAMTDDRRGG